MATRNVPKDLQTHLQLLEENGKLVRVDREINKDTLLHPLVRWQFRGLEEKNRKAFLFQKVVDSRDQKFTIPVAVGAIAGSQEIYDFGVGCGGNDTLKLWEEALTHPVAPRIVDSGPVQEVVHIKDTLLEHGGLEELPVPISTPGFDNAPYLSAALWIAKDPDTGIRNIGQYRGQIKGQLKTAIQTARDFGQIWEKYNARGEPMPAAAVIGASPSVYFASVEVMPFGFDELGIAGVLQGEPVELVRCKSIDLEVPAWGEIVLEGKVRTDVLEPEGSFGESHGYSDPRTLSFIFEVTAITHRKNPIFLSVISQLTPSESSKMKQKGYEADFYNHLRNHCGFREVTEVRLYEDLLNRQFGVIKMKKRSPFQPMNALYAFIARRGICKFLVAVDDDIDATDPTAVNWAIITRSQPHRDLRIIHPRPLPWGPLQYVADGTRYDHVDSAVLIDATQKAPLPPVSLPDRLYMEDALKVWQELGLPEVKPRNPWFGYSLGDWTQVSTDEAQLAVRGRYYETADKLATQQIHVKQGTRLSDIRHHTRPL